MNGFVDTMTNGGWKAIANGAGMWMAVIPTVIALCAQAVVFIRQAIKAGPMVGLTKDDISTAMKAGTICTIGPGMSMFTVMVAFMNLIGAPYAWLRLSIIGTITTEMLGATAGATALGVEKETGFTLGYDKYNWEEHPDHFILADCTHPVDFGEGKKSIYALEGTEILVQREKEVQMAVHGFGAGRCVYLSGLPYSFENSRVLYRSILWASHSEDRLHRWFSSNCNVEVHAYVKSGKYCVVNNTYEPQSTTVYRGDGSSFTLDLGANEIKWYEFPSESLE